MMAGIKIADYRNNCFQTAPDNLKINPLICSLIRVIHFNSYNLSQKQMS